ncbi:hypothetical protein SAMN04487950_1380 [Halogranum rubrum]|uniref:Uncharacterized protein n=1 Tax=Halogranum rubrum TaxID=553466 RepID=A0A1I4CTT1_9EURY|nr:hypothetical protein [Halogranum rubrum]SFK84173.1 hypothetical protein SAMN04487950_1380 [Halogranum rubrum]
MALHSRRDVLRLGSAAAATSLAGCASLPFVSRPKLTLTVLNHTEQAYRLTVDFYRTDRNERGEAHVFGREYDLAGGNGEESQTSDENIVPSRRYLVRVAARTRDGGVTSLRDHYHFYPDCDGTDEPSDRIYVEVEPRPARDPRLSFSTSGCSPDSIYL